MTTTNQAFIKVYRQDAAQAGLGRAIADNDRLPAVALGASVEIVGTTTNHGIRSAGHHVTAVNTFATSIDVLAPTAQPADTSTFLFKAGLGEAIRTNHPQQSFQRDNVRVRAKKPLSAFIARQQFQQPVISKTATTPFRAGTTVASFRWPTVCRALAQESATELDSIADLLMERVALGHSMFGVMSLFPSGGCTTTAFCLAAKLAARGPRVVLIEGSFCTPRLAQWLDVVPTASWQEVLDSKASLTDALVHSVAERLDVLLLSSALPSDPLLSAASPQAMNTGEVLRQRYELAIVDLGAYFDPRSQPVALELTRSMGIDAVVVVAGPHPVDDRDLATVEENLNGRGCELLGVIENRVANPTTNY